MSGDKLLKNEQDKIDWNLLSLNENAIHLLEQNQYLKLIRLQELE